MQHWRKQSMPSPRSNCASRRWRRADQILTQQHARGRGEEGGRAHVTCQTIQMHPSHAHVHVDSHMPDTEARQLQQSSFSRSYLCFVLDFSPRMLQALPHVCCPPLAPHASLSDASPSGVTSREPRQRGSEPKQHSILCRRRAIIGAVTGAPGKTHQLHTHVATQR